MCIPDPLISSNWVALLLPRKMGTKSSPLRILTRMSQLVSFHWSQHMPVNLLCTTGVFEVAIWKLDEAFDHFHSFRKSWWWCFREQTFFHCVWIFILEQKNSPWSSSHLTSCALQILRSLSLDAHWSHASKHTIHCNQKGKQKGNQKHTELTIKDDRHPETKKATRTATRKAIRKATTKAIRKATRVARKMTTKATREASRKNRHEGNERGKQKRKKNGNEKAPRKVTRKASRKATRKPIRKTWTLTRKVTTESSRTRIARRMTARRNHKSQKNDKEKTSWHHGASRCVDQVIPHPRPHPHVHQKLCY